MGFHGRRFHSSIGVVTVSMSYCFLLVSLSSILSCLRRRILGVTPGLGFLGNPAHTSRLRLAPAPMIDRMGAG